MATYFAEKDVVRLVAGGVTMTVVRIEGEWITCAWGGSLDDEGLDEEATALCFG